MAITQSITENKKLLFSNHSINNRKQKQSYCSATYHSTTENKKVTVWEPLTQQQKTKKVSLATTQSTTENKTKKVTVTVIETIQSTTKNKTEKGYCHRNHSIKNRKQKKVTVSVWQPLNKRKNQKPKLLFGNHLINNRKQKQKKLLSQVPISIFTTDISHNWQYFSL